MGGVQVPHFLLDIATWERQRVDEDKNSNTEAQIPRSAGLAKLQAELWLANFYTEDREEGTRSFLEKRKPHFVTTQVDRLKTEGF